ncbi:membrane protein [Achromatium sp. WMS3]|nr:membrane protein [Achromatium sp. WMS3]
MQEFITALTQYTFLQTALIAGILASIGCGIIGPFVVVKRISYLAGGIAHSVLSGMGIALYLQFDPFIGALIAAIAAALIIGTVRLVWDTQEDTMIGALWAMGMAIGILFSANTPGYNTDLMSYLIGNILLVSTKDLWWMAGLDIFLLIIMGLFYNQFLAIAFDEEFAWLRGVPVTFFYLLLLCLIAVTVVLLIRVVGLILVIALLTLPAAIALQFIHILGWAMLVAILLGGLFTSAGLAIAYSPDWPVGPTIILLAGLAYLLSTIISKAIAHQYSRHSFTTNTNKT